MNHDAATEQMTQTANALGERLPAAASYVGAGVSVGSALTLTEVGIVIGIVTALLTFAGNMIYQWRRDRREQREHDLRIQGMILERRSRQEPCDVERRQQ